MTMAYVNPRIEQYQYLYERPAAQAYGIGQCVVGGIEYTSNGVSWSAAAEVSTKVALIGDSTTAQNSSVPSTTYWFNNKGPIVWALRHLGYPVEFTTSDNFGVGGVTTRQCIQNQLPLLAVAHETNKYSYAFISVGTNDTTSSLGTRKSDTLELFTKIRELGIKPISVGIRPRGADVADQDYKKSARAINKYIYELSKTGLVEYIDVASIYADLTTAYGNMISTFSGDNLHPSVLGAYSEGKYIADTLTGKLGTKSLVLASESADLFDRTYNPYGSILSNPLLSGGTTAPTGYATTGGTWSKVTRTLTNGQTRSDPTCAMAASTNHNIYAELAATGDWDADQLQTGDKLEGRAKIVVTSGVNITNIQLRIVERDGGSTIWYYDDGETTPAGVIPDGTYTLYLKTPVTTIRPWSGTSNSSVSLRLSVLTGSGGSGTLTVQGFEIRPISVV